MISRAEQGALASCIAAILVVMHRDVGRGEEGLKMYLGEVLGLVSAFGWGRCS